MPEVMALQAPRGHAAAVNAWAELRPHQPPPAAVTRLQRKEKALVYRLGAVGPDGSDVVAKRSSRARILHERALYEDVLPAVGVPTVRYYGSVDEPGGEFGWIFVEDAGGEEYSPAVEEHRALAARWLALLHTSAARLSAAARLPERGPDFYFAHLQSARDRIERGLSNPALTADDLAVLAAVVRQCRVVESRWREIEQLCAGLPRTLIHGDFAPKNVRVRGRRGECALLPFDWGSAGWGIPAADLVEWTAPDGWTYWAGPDLAIYSAAVRDTWPELDVAALRPVATVGKIFRCLVCISLSAQCFATEWVERAARNMRVYRAEMAGALSSAGWPAGEDP